MNSHNNLGRREFLIGASGTTLLASSNFSKAAQSTPPPLASLFGGPFSLIDHNGKPRTDKDFLGKFMLIYFGYTFCPDICPVNLQHGADALQELGETSKQITPMFITIDPQRDTPMVLKEYVANFGDAVVGLTGSEKQVRAVAKAYRIHRRKVLPAGETDKQNYLVDHSSITYLMGPDGKFVTLFPHNTSGKEIASRIRTYLAAS